MKTIGDLTIDEFKELVKTAIKESVNEVLHDIDSARTDNFVSTMEKALEEYKIGNTMIFEKLRGIYL